MTAMVGLPPAVSTVVYELCSRLHEMLVQADIVPRTNIHQHIFICINTQRTDLCACLTLLPYTSCRAVVTSMQYRKAGEI